MVHSGLLSKQSSYSVFHKVTTRCLFGKIKDTILFFLAFTPCSYKQDMKISSFKYMKRVPSCPVRIDLLFPITQLIH